VNKIILQFILLICLVNGCTKAKDTTYSIAIQGRVIHDETRSGLPGIKVYTDWGEPCCGGLAKTLGGDSTITDATGNYRIELTYPRDTLIYRFITYLRAVTLVPKFYYYNFGSYIQDYGVVEFDYSQMVVPSTIEKLPDQLIHECNFSVLPIGVINFSHLEKTPPDGDTLHIKIKRLDKNEVYKEYAWLSNIGLPTQWLPVIAGPKTEINIIISNSHGLVSNKKDTITMNKGEKREWLIEH
jgi:hypothetical protein